MQAITALGDPDQDNVTLCVIKLDSEAGDTMGSAARASETAAEAQTPRLVSTAAVAEQPAGQIAADLQERRPDGTAAASSREEPDSVLILDRSRMSAGHGT